MRLCPKGKLSSKGSKLVTFVKPQDLSVLPKWCCSIGGLELQRILLHLKFKHREKMEIYSFSCLSTDLLPSPELGAGDTKVPGLPRISPRSPVSGAPWRWRRGWGWRQRLGERSGCAAPSRPDRQEPGGERGATPRTSSRRPRLAQPPPTRARLASLREDAPQEPGSGSPGLLGAPDAPPTCPPGVGGGAATWRRLGCSGPRARPPPLSGVGPCRRESPSTPTPGSSGRGTPDDPLRCPLGSSGPGHSASASASQTSGAPEETTETRGSARTPPPHPAARRSRRPAPRPFASLPSCPRGGFAELSGGAKKSWGFRVSRTPGCWARERGSSEGPSS